MLTTMIQTLINALGGLIDLTSALPQSPFAQPIRNLQNAYFIGYISYFFPIRDMLTVLQYWLSAIGFYYLVKTLLRWMKVIQ